MRRAMVSVAFAGVCWLIGCQYHDVSTPELLGRLESPGADHLGIAEALARRGRPASEPLADALAHPEPGVHRSAAYALRLMGPPAADAVTPLLAHPNEDVRWRAVWALPADPVSVSPLTETLSDPSEYVRALAAVRLLDIQPDNEAAIAVFAHDPVYGPSDDDGELIALVSHDGGFITDEDSGPDPDYVGSVDNVDFVLTVPSRGAILRKVGPRAMPYILKDLADPDPWTRISALADLAALGDAASGATPAVIELLDDPHHLVPREAIDALVAINPDPALAVPALLEISRGDTEIAHDALVALGPPAIEPLAAAALEHEDWYVRYVAIETLGRMGPAAAPAMLEVFPKLSHENRVIMAYSMRAMPSATDGLIRLLAHDDPSVRANAAFALGRIHPPQRKALPALRQAAANRVPWVADNAAKAIESILHPPPPKPPPQPSDGDGLFVPD